jgi:hypothetical protein
MPKHDSSPLRLHRVTPAVLFSTSYTARLNEQLQLLFCLLLEICVATPLAASIEPWQPKHVLELAIHTILQLDNRLTHLTTYLFLLRLG